LIPPPLPLSSQPAGNNSPAANETTTEAFFI
jgi:hypothetical protein